ncbi:CesT family type III secretion system chaperone [Robbsia sp. Bb-Pol-6]|uniref:CesT family type III secretion system chaperone n=1 Tax=Robbsia betulipollinis TaxID=2981849 RepID=A0ABT3ZQ37_9BURK|nr:CesT family type III secretion system chaperone [Robbsia betulipollinis]MCY0388681.1 CesT family type III secretion system chaperone [Robbsia betulipollinis]
MQADEQDAGAYQRLLDETGAKVRIGGLVLDEAGMCWLRVGGTIVVVRQDLRLQGLLLFREVMESPPDAPPPLAAGASLHPLLDGMPMLCRLPEDNRLVCMAFLPLVEFAPSRLLHLLARLVDWRSSACAAATSTRERE